MLQSRRGYWYVIRSIEYGLNKKYAARTERVVNLKGENTMEREIIVILSMKKIVKYADLYYVFCKKKIKETCNIKL
jgi:hypothetical protein